MVRATNRRNAATAVLLVGVVVGMTGLAYASVPLYRWFCQVTGFGGTTQVADRLPERVLDRVDQLVRQAGDLLRRDRLGGQLLDFRPGRLLGHNVAPCFVTR